MISPTASRRTPTGFKWIDIDALVRLGMLRTVVAGLDPATQTSCVVRLQRHARKTRDWIAGSSPAMTGGEADHRGLDECRSTRGRGARQGFARQAGSIADATSDWKVASGQAPATAPSHFAGTITCAAGG